MTTTVSSAAGPDQLQLQTPELQTPELQTPTPASASTAALGSGDASPTLTSTSAAQSATRLPVDVAFAGAVSAALTRRGYLTTEWWTTVVGAALSTVLALIGIHGAAAAQAIAIGAPVLLAGTYAVSRSMHKSHLTALVADALPQSSRPV